ncbi:MAG: RNA polymerase sigma-70 factor (ECF subfamily) [Crocinitomicaceae bacterium]
MFRKDQIPKLTDERLVELLSSNRSNEALTELHARYSNKVLGYFVRMLHGDLNKAQDFVQELFMKILEKHHQFDLNRKFYTWMFTIASNMCKTEYRSTNRMTYSGKESDFETGADWNENFADKDLFNSKLKTAISKLEVHHREAFVLRHVQDLSINEISEILNISKGTVKSRIFYGTKIIAKELIEFKPTGEGSVFKMN